MRKALTALAAAATITAATLATSTSADAWRWRGGWRGPAFVGGLAAGALIGGALAAPYAPYYGYGYPPSYAYYGGPYYYGGYSIGGYSNGYAYTGYNYGYGNAYAYYGDSAMAYSCARRAWNGYRWVRFAYAC